MAESAQQCDFAALERGEIVRWGRAPIALPSEDDQEFLHASLAPYLARKNIPAGETLLR
ncbi:MAG: hypothetical protein ACJ79P_21130 [Myxococcales bacterium]